MIELKTGEVYVIESESNEYICVLKSVSFDSQFNTMVYRDYFCLDSTRGLICDELPITSSTNLKSIRLANIEEKNLLFSAVYRELVLINNGIKKKGG